MSNDRNWGGRRDGAGRPKGKEKSRVEACIDSGLLEAWRRLTDRGAFIERALRRHITFVQQADGLFRVTHEAGVSIIFPRGHFNDQQRVEATAGALDGMTAMEAAAIMREMGDWVAAYHYDEAMNERGEA